MSRVLQIRRGTAAQNDNFTGLPGEITYDTTAKTIRVHDGATLGGVALARADEIPESGGGSDFDIDSVPDTKWTEIFSRIAPTPFTEYSSTNMIVHSVPFTEYIFSDVFTMPIVVRAHLVCMSDAAGYAAGNETTAFGIGDSATPLFYTFVDQNGLHVRTMIGNSAFWVAHRETGIKTNTANDQWRLKISIYC